MTRSATDATDATDAAAKPAKKANPIATAYLVLYNTVLLAGWGYVLYLTAAELAATNGQWQGVYKLVELPLKYAQTAAVLEVLHVLFGAHRVGARTVPGATGRTAPADCGRGCREARARRLRGAGLVRSRLPVTIIQVASRLFILWGVADAFPAVCHRAQHADHAVRARARPRSRRLRYCSWLTEARMRAGANALVIHDDGAVVGRDRGRALRILRHGPDQRQAIHPDVAPVRPRFMRPVHAARATRLTHARPCALGHTGAHTPGTRSSSSSTRPALAASLRSATRRCRCWPGRRGTMACPLSQKVRRARSHGHTRARARARLSALPRGLPVFPVQYLHMISQRAIYVGGAKKPTKKTH